MPKITIDGKIETKRREYAAKYNIDELSSGNDKSNLELLIYYEVMIEEYLDQIKDKMKSGDIDGVGAVTKQLGVIQENKLALEKSLGIDRVARKKENSSESPAEYIAFLKAKSKEFLEQRIQKVYCPKCTVMVFRFLPVHEHTAFEIKCKCSQCGEMVRIKREDKDIFVDLAPKDRDWRKQFPVEIVPVKKDTTDDIDAVDDEMIIGE